MKCNRCGSTNHLYRDSTYKLKSGEHRTRYKCRDCNTMLRRQAYNRSAKYRETIKRINREFIAKNPRRQPAWTAAQKIPVQPCEECGDTRIIHRHHPDPRKQLDVVFLCPKHHSARHIDML